MTLNTVGFSELINVDVSDKINSIYQLFVVYHQFTGFALWPLTLIVGSHDHIFFPFLIMWV